MAKKIKKIEKVNKPKILLFDMDKELLCGIIGI